MKRLLWLAILLPTMLTAQVDIAKREIKADTLKARVTKLYVRGVLSSNDSASFRHLVKVNGDSVATLPEVRSYAHPRLGLTTLNLYVDTIKARGKFKINDTTVIYLPNQSASAFQGSIFFGTGGRYSTHTTGSNGFYNTAVGIGAMQSNTTGNSNFAIGYQSMFYNATGFGNVALGRESLKGNITGSNTTAIGTNSLLVATGGQNTAVGLNTGMAVTTGIKNTIIGGAASTNGNLDSCVIIGFRAGFGTTRKGLNQKAQIKIGNAAGYLDTTNYTLYIDNSSTTNYLTPLIGGRFDLNRVSINKLMPACGDSTFNVGGGIDARGLKLSGNASALNYYTFTDTAAMLSDVRAVSSLQDSTWNEITVTNIHAPENLTLIADSGDVMFLSYQNSEHSSYRVWFLNKYDNKIQGDINSQSVSKYSRYLQRDSSISFIISKNSGYTDILNLTLSHEDLILKNNSTEFFKVTSTGQIKTTQTSAALTDNAPTDVEIDTATGLTPATAGAGYQVTIKDSNGTSLLYKIESDGTNWFYLVMTQAL